MKVSTYTCLILIITVWTCIMETDAIMCYNCTSKTNSNCGLTLTNKDSIPTVECGTGQCAKIDANIEIGNHKDEFFTRMCIPLCTEVCGDTPGGTMCSFCCTSDLCNAGSTITSFIGVFIVSMIAFILNIL